MARVLFFTGILIVSTCFVAVAKETSIPLMDKPDPSVSALNADLIKGADAVIRYDKRRFEIRGPGSGRLHVSRMITILNADGLYHSSVTIPYNNFITVRNLSAEIFNAGGDRIRRVRSREFEDESMVSSISLAEDSRKKTAELVHNQYPYTIKIEYRLDLSGFIQPPYWIPIPSERTALQYAEMEVDVPADMNLDFRMYNIPDSSHWFQTSETGTRYIWNLQQVPAIEREILGPPWFELLPALVKRPEEFSMDRHRGSLNTWASMASWFGTLWQGRDELPADVKEQVDRMKGEYGHTRSLIDAIYRHVQQNTRYVSIQLGIGGFQTEKAVMTAQNRYGDCKALSNYMLGMLRYAGFDAYAALIRNGSHLFPFDPDFVHDPFNHVVIMIPFEGEEIWIEATSSIFPAGYIGSSNTNRYALIFRETGGELVRTPALSNEDNFQYRSAEIELSADGKAVANVKTHYGGSQHENIRYLSAQRDGVRSRAIREMIPFNLYTLSKESIEADSLRPEAIFNLELEIESFASRIGSRLMFQPNLMERSGSNLPSNDDRKQPVYIRSAYHDTDEITINLPDTHEVEALPEPIHLEFEYGYYSSSVELNDDGKSLLYKRVLFMRPGILPPEEYNSYRTFLNERVRYDNSQVVLVAK
jgi:hypothetical protein